MAWTIIACLLVGFIFGVLFISILASGKISDLYSEIDQLKIKLGDKCIQINNMRKTWALDTETLIKTMRELKKTKEFVSYKHISEKPPCVDWYAVIRISHEYKTPYRDYALYKKDEDRWGGSDLDQVVYWLPAITMPLDPHKKYDILSLEEI